MQALKKRNYFLGLGMAFLLQINSLAALDYVEGIWAKINPNSLLEYLSFMELYPDSSQAKMAQSRIEKRFGSSIPANLPLQELGSALVNRLLAGSSVESQPMDESVMTWIEAVASKELMPIPAGRSCKSLKELEKLPVDQWDMTQVAYLCSGLNLVYQEPESRALHAKVDMLALCAKFAVQGKSYKNNTERDLDMIQALNQVIFQEQGFAFPSLLDYMSRIDSYTSLPSLIDSKKGVCLGVSVLYLALAQRVGLPLTIVTPPGHIFLRYVEKQESIADGKNRASGEDEGSGDRPVKLLTRNIETTAYGMELPDETYRPLEGEMWVERSLREVPGLIFINAASVQLGQLRFNVAEKNYEVALRFLNPKTSFFVRELAAYASWLANPQKGMVRINRLWQEYRLVGRRGEGSALVFDPILLEDISQGRLQPSMVESSFQKQGEDLRTQLESLSEIEASMKLAKNSRWLKLQQAMAQWHLGYVDQAWDSWPRSLRLDPKWQYVKVQLALASGHNDEALKAFRLLANQLEPADRAVMTPFDSLKRSLQERFFTPPAHYGNKK